LGHYYFSGHKITSCFSWQEVLHPDFCYSLASLTGPA
jgi:hypothetical protein